MSLHSLFRHVCITLGCHGVVCVENSWGSGPNVTVTPFYLEVQTHLNSSLPCQMANVDIVLFSGKKDAEAVKLLLQSIEDFMLCFGRLYIEAPPSEIRYLKRVVPRSLDVLFNPRKFPPELEQLPRRYHVAFFVLFLDEVSSAPYIMMLDSDVVFTMPVTCRMLFDDDGRPDWFYWEWDTWRWVDKSVMGDLKLPAIGNFMSNYPMTVPRVVFAEARKVISQAFNTSVIDAYAQLVRRHHKVSPQGIVGHIAALSFPDMVHAAPIVHRRDLDSYAKKHGQPPPVIDLVLPALHVPYNHQAYADASYTLKEARIDEPSAQSLEKYEAGCIGVCALTDEYRDAVNVSIENGKAFKQFVIRASGICEDAAAPPEPPMRAFAYSARTRKRYSMLSEEETYTAHARLGDLQLERELCSDPLLGPMELSIR